MPTQVNAPKPFILDELFAQLPVAVRNLKLNREPVNNVTIRRELYNYVIESLYSTERFMYSEEQPNHLQGSYIKGYVRDITGYLQEAYAMIHGIDYEVAHEDILVA